jgi:hypothetical protein
MAYMSQENKKQIKVELDKVLKPMGFKYSLGVRHHSTLVLNIWAGPVDFISNYYHSDVLPRAPVTKQNYIDLNPYHYRSYFTGDTLSLLDKVFDVLNNGNHDRSDSQSDYFDVGWYVDVNIGRYDRPYVLRT